MADETNKLALQGIYGNEFGRTNIDYFQKYIHIDESWRPDLLKLFDNDSTVVNQMTQAPRVTERILKVTSKLIAKGDIIYYKMFIDFWKKRDLANATIFEKSLFEKIGNAGLTEVDQRLQVPMTLSTAINSNQSAATAAIATISATEVQLASSVMSTTRLAELTDDNNSFLNIAYKKAFENLRSFIEISFPVSKCIGSLLEKEIIDKDCRVKLVNATTPGQKSKILMDYLLEQERTVTAYNAFIELCDSKNYELAKRIRQEIEKEKNLVGLQSATNNTILDVATTTGADNRNIMSSTDMEPAKKEKLIEYPSPNPRKWINNWGKAIKENESILLDNVNLDACNDIFETLIAKSVLSKNEVDSLRALNELAEQNAKFIEAIKRKYPQHIDDLIKTLHPSSPVLADILRDMLDEAYKASQ